MKYLELDELVVGQEYNCIPYDSKQPMLLRYLGKGMFEDHEFTYTVNGDIRYVLPNDEPDPRTTT